ncbi:PcfB family protein [Butyrivibrio sp. MC2021]|uniref:PcfB family protein n=1 Tax=Butyrivibrio sp. MC2021 TaxID=1408306 RepID=UPI00056BB26E|nr:PcfB family protein [Butyrivibrio sp. MC2021]
MNNEQVAKESIRFAFNTTKISATVLLKGLIAAYKAYKKSQDKTGKGKQTVKQLIKQGQGATSLEISGESLSDFKRIANRYGVDFAIVKDKTSETPRYTVFFKAKDADAITAVLKEYADKLVKKNQVVERPSVLKKLHDIQKRLAKEAAKDLEKTKELVR